MIDETPGRHAWSASDRFVPRTFVQPLQRFLETEAAGGVVLVSAAVAAIDEAVEVSTPLRRRPQPR
jgi:hypothetical protein